MKKEVILKTALNKSHALSQGLQKRKETKIGQKIIEKFKTMKSQCEANHESHEQVNIEETKWAIGSPRDPWPRRGILFPNSIGHELVRKLN